MILPLPRCTLFPYTTLFRSVNAALNTIPEESMDLTTWIAPNLALNFKAGNKVDMLLGPTGATKYLDVSYVRKGKSLDRKSTRLNSSHRCISYAVFCLKKKSN